MADGPQHRVDLAERIARSLGVGGEPVRHGDGWSNNVWLYDDVVIRIALRPGPGALAVEGLIAPRLPAAVGYPAVIGSGVLDGHDWMAQQRLPGDNLAARWDLLDQDQRAFAIGELVTRLDGGHPGGRQRAGAARHAALRVRPGSGGSPAGRGRIDRR
jgi:hypothetical protein